MEKNQKQLTIGLLVYNEERYISETIKSLLNQTYQNFNLIILDNASTDKTAEICKNYEKKDNRIIFIGQSENKGSFFSFKHVLEKTKTPYFMFCAGHDQWESSFIEKLLPIIQKEKLALVYPQAREITMENKLGEVYEEDYTTIGIEKPAKRYEYVLKKMGMCNAIYGIWNTDILKKCYVKKPIIAGDVLIILKASLLGKFKQHKEVLFYRRTIRKENNQYSRQIRYAAGENRKGRSVVSLKNKFVKENLKILHEEEFGLKFFEKKFLSLLTLIIWFKKIYLRSFLISFLKRLLPEDKYLVFESKMKKKIKKFL